MNRSRKVGSRKRRATLVGAIVAAATMAFGVGSANALVKSLSATFDDAALTLPFLPTSADVLEPPNTATMTGTVDDSNGAVNVAAVDFVFPSSTGMASGIPVKVDFKAVAPISGTLDLATGALTTTASNYEADVQLNPPGGTTCVYNPISLALTTSGGSPIAGHTFTVTNGTNVSIATGILQTTWTNSTFPNGTGGDCSLIDSILHGGNGQLALGNGFDLTPEIAPPPSGGGTVTSAPKKKKCKKGQKKVKVHGKIKCKKKK